MMIIRLSFLCILLATASTVSLAAGVRGGAEGAATNQRQQQQLQQQQQPRELVDASLALQYEDSQAETASNTDTDTASPPTPPKQQQQEEPERTILTVQAKDFSIPSSIVLDEEAGNLSHLSAGDVLGLQVHVPVSGLYRVEARFCNPNFKGQLWVYDTKSSAVLSKIDYIPPTKDWNTWATSRLGMIELTEGTASLNLLIQQGGFNLQFLTLTHVNPSMAAYLAPTPTTHTFVFPASAYTKASASVVVEAPMGGMPSVGGIQDGTFLDYDLDDTLVPGLIPGATYRLGVATSTPAPDAGHIRIVQRQNHHILAERKGLPATGGWYTWETSSIGDITIPTDNEKEHLAFQFVAFQGNFNLLLFTLEQVVSPAAETATDTVASAKAVEDDEVFRDGLDLTDLKLPTQQQQDQQPYQAFYWAANAVEMEGVKLERSSEGGPGNLGGLDENDYFVYDLDLPATGTYRLSLRVASGWIRGAIDFIENGGSLDLFNYETGELLDSIEDIPTSNGWQSWITVHAQVHNLSDGPLQVEMRVRQGGFNFLWWQIEGPVTEDEAD